MQKRSLCWTLSSGPQVLPLVIFCCEIPKWKKGSVQCALQAFQAISLLPYPALVLFSKYSNTWYWGSEQYLGTIFQVKLSILGCSAVWFLWLCLVQAKVSCILSLQNWTWALKQVLKKTSLCWWSYCFCVFYLMTLLLLFEKNCACFTRNQEHKTNQISSVLAFWGYHRPLLFCFLSRFGASDTSYSFG